MKNCSLQNQHAMKSLRMEEVKKTENISLCSSRRFLFWSIFCFHSLTISVRERILHNDQVCQGKYYRHKNFNKNIGRCEMSSSNFEVNVTDTFRMDLLKKRGSQNVNKRFN